MVLRFDSLRRIMIGARIVGHHMTMGEQACLSRSSGTLKQTDVEVVLRGLLHRNIIYRHSQACSTR